MHELLLGKSRVRPDQLYKIGKALAAWAGEERTPTLEALALSAGLGSRIAGALLAVLEEAELVRVRDGTIEVTAGAAIEQEARKLAGQFETLRTEDGRRLDAIAAYSHTTDCRAVFLRSAFGEENGKPCGLCDVCRGHVGRPDSFWEPVQRPPRKKRGRPERTRRRKHRGGRRGQRQAASKEQAPTAAQPPAPAAREPRSPAVATPPPPLPDPGAPLS